MSGLLNLISKSTLLWNAWDEIVDAVSNFVGSLLWVFCDIFFVILDLFENLFRMFAGISSSVKTSSGSIIEGDLVLYFINSDIVQEMFFSIIVLSFILLLIFTIFAIVKNQYAEKQEPVTKIINSSFKALLMYLLVPVATVVCLIVGNVVLQAIDGATKLNSSGGASDMLFAAATYNANRLRSGSDEDRANQLDGIIKSGYLSQQTKDELSKAAGVSSVEDIVYATEVDWDDLAQIIDEAFVQEGIDTPDGGVNQKADKWNFAFVNNYYYGLKISFITIWVGGAFLIWAIGKMAWGMVARLFKMVLFFALSPAVMATFPIQGDKALGAWRSEMVKNGTSAYCAVGVLNVLYSILPFFNGIKLGIYGGLGTAIAKLFIYIIAFSSAQNLISTVSGWFGTGNALADGIAAKGQVDKQIGLKKVATNVGGAFAGLKEGRKAGEILYGKAKKKSEGGTFAERHKGAFGRFGATITGAFGATDLAKDGPLSLVKDIQGRGKKGGEFYQDLKTSPFGGKNAEKNKQLFELDKAMKDSVKATEKLIEALDKARQLELAKAKTDEDKNKINTRYDRAVGDAKFKAQFMDGAWEARKMSIESEKQAYDQDMGHVAPLDNWLKATKKEESFKQRLATGVDGGYAKVQTNWNKMVKNNDFSGFGDQADAVKEAFGQMFDSIMENNETLQLSTEGIKKITTQGGVAAEYYKGVFGDSFNGDMKGNKADYSAKIEAEMQRLKDVETSITSSQKQLRDEIIKEYDNVKNSARALDELIKKNTKKS